MYSNKKNRFPNALLKAEIAQANELAKAVNVDDLDAFDRASIEFVNQYKGEAEVAAFRDQIKRICELAGINYELDKQRWWSKHHQQKAKRD
jgi:hypothetical protein